VSLAREISFIVRIRERRRGEPSVELHFGILVRSGAREKKRGRKERKGRGRGRRLDGSWAASAPVIRDRRGGDIGRRSLSRGRGKKGRRKEKEGGRKGESDRLACFLLTSKANRRCAEADPRKRRGKGEGKEGSERRRRAHLLEKARRALPLRSGERERGRKRKKKGEKTRRRRSLTILGDVQETG